MNLGCHDARWDAKVKILLIFSGTKSGAVTLGQAGSQQFFLLLRMIDLHGAKRLTLRIRLRPAREQAGGFLYVEDV